MATLKEARERDDRRRPTGPIVRDDPTFGAWLDFRHLMPHGTDAIITSVNQYGRRPQALLLPHQFYVRNALALFADRDTFQFEGAVEVLPIRTEDFIAVPRALVKAVEVERLDPKNVEFADPLGRKVRR